MEPSAQRSTAARAVDDLDVMLRGVGRLREQGAEVDALADRLVARLDALAWRGRAADTMRERVVVRAQQLRRVAERHDRAAEALAVHAGAVDRARDQIAVTEARTHRLLADARERIDRAAATGTAVERVDLELVAFEPPPPGHAAWLDVDVPGPERVR